MIEEISRESISTGFSLSKAVHRRKSANRRLILKNGEFNISQRGIKKRKQQYLADIFTTLIDLKWRWALIMFTMTFIISWTFFALIWWAIAYVKGDIINVTNPEWSACVIGVDGFVTALLFSIETQHTIGYGTRSITKHCPEAVIVLMIQATFGVIIQALMTGLVFAKLARPKKRAETLMFSDRACICTRNGNLVFLIRVGDMRSSHIIGARCTALLVKRKVTEEGEVIPLETKEIDLGVANNCLLLSWPVIIEHKIDYKSPFWKFSKDDLDNENFEVLVILEGSVPSTGANTQAITSYLPEEISWGYRFDRLTTYQRDDGKYLFDYKRFHAVIPTYTPSCSGEELSKLSAFQQPLNTSMKQTIDSLSKWVDATKGQTVEDSETSNIINAECDLLLDTFVKMKCQKIQVGAPLLNTNRQLPNNGTSREVLDECSDISDTPTNMLLSKKIVSHNYDNCTFISDTSVTSSVSLPEHECKLHPLNNDNPSGCIIEMNCLESINL